MDEKKLFTMNWSFWAGIKDEDNIKRYPLLDEGGEIDYNAFGVVDQLHVLLAYSELRKNDYMHNHFNYIHRKELLKSLYRYNHILSDLKILLQIELNTYFQEEKKNELDIQDAEYFNNLLLKFIELMKDLKSNDDVFHFFGRPISELGHKDIFGYFRNIFNYDRNEEKTFLNMLFSVRDNGYLHGYVRIIIIFISFYTTLGCISKNKKIPMQLNNVLTHMETSIKGNPQEINEELIPYVADAIDESIETEQTYFQKRIIHTSLGRNDYMVSSETHRVYIALEEMVKQINQTKIEGTGDKKINCIAVLRFIDERTTCSSSTFLSIAGADLEGEHKTEKLEAYVRELLEDLKIELSENLELIGCHERVRYYLEDGLHSILQSDTAEEIKRIKKIMSSDKSKISESKEMLNLLRRMFSCCERKIIYNKNNAYDIITKRCEMLVMFKSCYVCERSIKRRNHYSGTMSIGIFDESKEGSFTIEDIRKTDEIAKTCADAHMEEVEGRYKGDENFILKFMVLR